VYGRDALGLHVAFKGCNAFHPGLLKSDS
jgi:hypothetical protein